MSASVYVFRSGGINKVFQRSASSKRSARTPLHPLLIPAWGQRLKATLSAASAANPNLRMSGQESRCTLLSFRFDREEECIEEICYHLYMLPPNVFTLHAVPALPICVGVNKIKLLHRSLTDFTGTPTLSGSNAASEVFNAENDAMMDGHIWIYNKNIINSHI